jgi:hypothetical protein
MNKHSLPLIVIFFCFIILPCRINGDETDHELFFDPLIVWVNVFETTYHLHTAPDDYALRFRFMLFSIPAPEDEEYYGGEFCFGIKWDVWDNNWQGFYIVIESSVYDIVIKEDDWSKHCQGVNTKWGMGYTWNVSEKMMISCEAILPVWPVRIIETPDDDSWIVPYPSAGLKMGFRF